MLIQTSETQVMAKRKAGSQNANLIPNQKKSRIDPIYLATDDVPHTIGKLSTRATTFLQTTPQSEVCSQSYGAPKSQESALAQFQREKPFGCRLCGQSQSIYYKGEGGGFPQVQAAVSLVCPCCPWLVLAPRVLQLCTNHLVWVMCKPVWVGEACQLFLVLFWSSKTPFYPQSVVSSRACPDSSFFRCFILGPTFGSFEELGMRQ